MYVPFWTRDTGTSSVNTGFFERQPGTKPGTTCVRPGTKDYDHGTTDDGAALNELNGLQSYKVTKFLAGGVPRDGRWKAGNFHRKKLSNCGMVRNTSEYFGLLP